MYWGWINSAHCAAWNWRTTFWFCCHFFQLTQNWTALNFEVNFRPLIQWDSRGLFSKSLMKLDDRLMTSKSERQRTSGPQKRSKVWFYVLSQIYFLTRAKPHKRIPCGKWEHLRHVLIIHSLRNKGKSVGWNTDAMKSRAHAKIFLISSLISLETICKLS